MNDFIQQLKPIVSDFTDISTGFIDPVDINPAVKICEILDNVTFDMSSQIYQFFSTFRYLLGDPLYIALTTLVILGVSLFLFKLLKLGINGILSFIPGFNIKLP